MSGKTIEIEKGDTFTITPGAATVDAYRDGRCVAIYYQNGTYREGCATQRAASEQDVSRPVALAILGAFGFTVVEKQPEAEAVVVTHGVQYPECDGLFSYVGTKAACDKFALECGGYVVVRIRFGGASNG